MPTPPHEQMAAASASALGSEAQLLGEIRALLEGARRRLASAVDEQGEGQQP